MKVALVHDYLNQYGGGERVLEVFAELFPDAPIYSLFYDAQKTKERFADKIHYNSFLNKEIVINNHRKFIPLMPLAAYSMNLGKKYDVILSSSAGYGKGIRHDPRTIHISYCHTPLRYAWEHYKYFDWSPLMKHLAAPAFWYLRAWDKSVAQKPHTLLANSQHIANKIQQYYGRTADVVYPPVDLKFFSNSSTAPRQGYFLAVGRMMRYKRFDLVVEAFNQLNLPLIIVGDGPDRARIQSLVRSRKINFAPFVSNEELKMLYSQAEALVFPQIEDFGLVAAEAQACGTPVVALAQGGACEIVQDGITGVLFHHQTVEDVVMAVKKLLLSSFDHVAIRESAKRFSKTTFKNRIARIVRTAYTSVTKA
ncbi:MAG: glycosyltransferase [bacterium]|nr:glycosyltransferase [bacterium]